MGMTKEGMAAAIQVRLLALDHAQTTNAGSAGIYQNLVLEAMCQGIIDHIQSSAVVTTTSGAPNSEHIGEIK